MNRQDYKKAFDTIPFSADFQERTTAMLQDRACELEKEQNSMKFGKTRKMAVLIAAAAALLVVSVSAANLDALQEIVWELRTSFFVSGTTEDGSFAAIRVPEVSLYDRDDRVILTVEGEETDITDALETEQIYSLEQTEEDGRIQIEVTGTPEDCVCTVTGYQENLEEPLFCVTYEKNQPVNKAEVEYSVAEERIEIDGSTVTDMQTVTLTKNDEFAVGHYDYDEENIYGLVTDDPMP